MKISKIIVNDLKFDVRVFKEAQALIESEYDCEVLAYTHDENRKVNNYTTLFFIEKKNKIIVYYRFFKKILNHFNNNKPDIIHTHDLAALPLGYILSKRFSAKLIFDAHELYHVIHNYRGLKKMLLKFLIPRTDGLITVNDSLLEIYKKEFNAKNGVVINNSPDFKKTNQNEQISRKQLFGTDNVNEEDFLMLFQGYIVPDRGLEKIIEIMKYLPEEFKLLILGDGSQKYISELKKVASLNNVDQKIIFKEAVPYDILQNYTSSASMGIYLIENTSLNQYYCLPNKIFEFLAAGLPVLSMDFPEINKILNQNKVGIVVSEEMEIKAIANKIVGFASSKEFVFAKEKLNEKRKEYTWEIEKKNLISYYKDVVSQL